MKLYADLPGRRAAQIASDIFVVLWAVLWIWISRVVHDVAILLAKPGEILANAGAGFRGRMNQAGDAVGNLPLLDDRIASPFRNVAGIGTSIEDAGRQFIDAVTTFALVLQLVTALVPILSVTLIWLLLRGRFVLAARAAQRFIDEDADLDVFALRAITRQPMHRLAKISPDPAGAWRRGDIAVIRDLALLELRDNGLRPPSRGGGAIGAPAPAST